MRGPRGLARDDRGATAIEYGLICGLVFVAIVAGASNLSTGLSALLYDVATKVSMRL